MCLIIVMGLKFQPSLNSAVISSLSLLSIRIDLMTFRSCWYVALVVTNSFPKKCHAELDARSREAFYTCIDFLKGISLMHAIMAWCKPSSQTRYVPPVLSSVCGVMTKS